MLCYVMLCHVTLCYVMLYYVMSCHVMLCYVMLCYVMIRYVMLCYIMLCYIMCCYTMLHDIFFTLIHLFYSISLTSIYFQHDIIQYDATYVPPTPLFNTDTNSECRSKILKCPTPACNKCTGISFEGTLGQNSRNVMLCCVVFIDTL